jgi:CxxC motif-containing protein
MGEAVKALSDVTLTAPVETGDVVIADVLGTGVDFIATKTFAKV